MSNAFSRAWRDFVWIVKILFYICAGIVMSLFLYSVLPESLQNKVTDGVLKTLGQHELTTTEIYTSVEPFEEAPRFIVGHQMIHDTIVVKHKKPMCHPAFYKVNFLRRASYVYDIADGKVEIEFVTEKVEHENVPSGGKGYCDYEAPPLSHEKVMLLQDSIHVISEFNPNYSEEEIKSLLRVYIREEHFLWKRKLPL